MVFFQESIRLPYTQAKQKLLDDIKKETEKGFSQNDNPDRKLQLHGITIDVEIAEALRNFMLTNPSQTKRGELDNKRQKVNEKQEQMWNVSLCNNSIGGNTKQVELLLQEALSVVKRLVFDELSIRRKIYLMDFLFCSPKALTNMNELSIQCCYVDLCSADTMNRWLKHNTSLKKLCFDNVEILSNQNGVPSVTHFVERMFQDVDSHAIQSLGISASKLDVKHLVQIIQSWHTLEQLRLGSSESFYPALCLKNLYAIVGLFCHPSCCKLKSLYVYCDCVREEGICKIFSALPHSTVETMEIGDVNTPMPGCFQELVECLRHPLTKLRRLELSRFARFSDEEKETILDILKTTNFRLEFLSLGYTTIFFPYLVLNWAGRRLLQDLNYPMLSSLLPHILARITTNNVNTIYQGYYYMEENDRIELCVNAQFHLLREGLLMACCVGDNE